MNDSPRAGSRGNNQRFSQVKFPQNTKWECLQSTTLLELFLQLSKVISSPLPGSMRWITAWAGIP